MEVIGSTHLGWALEMSWATGTLRSAMYASYKGSLRAFSFFFSAFLSLRRARESCSNFSPLPFRRFRAPPARRRVMARHHRKQFQRNAARCAAKGRAQSHRFCSDASSTVRLFALLSALHCPLRL
eukprot:529921-Prymnesium_polylepis.1